MLFFIDLSLLIGDVGVLVVYSREGMLLAIHVLVYKKDVYLAF